MRSVTFAAREVASPLPLRIRGNPRGGGWGKYSSTHGWQVARAARAHLRADTTKRSERVGESKTRCIRPTKLSATNSGVPPPLPPPGEVYEQPHRTKKGALRAAPVTLFPKPLSSAQSDDASATTGRHAETTEHRQGSRSPAVASNLYSCPRLIYSAQKGELRQLLRVLSAEAKAEPAAKGESAPDYRKIVKIFGSRNHALAKTNSEFKSTEEKLLEISGN